MRVFWFQYADALSATVEAGYVVARYGGAAKLSDFDVRHRQRTSWYSATPLLGLFCFAHDFGSALLTAVLGAAKRGPKEGRILDL